MATCLGCKAAAPAVSIDETPVLLIPEQSTPEPAPVTTAVPETPQPRLKYIFLFIGDGMGPNQVLCVNTALAAQGAPPLRFTEFPVQGEAITNNVSEKVTDSAAAATALSTGTKTANGMLGQDPSGARRVGIAEMLHANGFSIGILTTVSLDNATPAGFYAHTGSRNNYKDIAMDLFISGFEYFAGGGFHDGADIEALANGFGYTLARGDAEADAAPNGRLVAISQSLASDRGMPLVLGQDAARQGQLSRNLTRAIERLSGNENGFFIMTEGGRIDLSCHYHDPGELYAETMDFDEAVGVALSFMQAHPEETLIVVTADHETGGLSLTGGDRAAIARQNICCGTFDETVTTRFQEEKTPFETALPEICSAFGLDNLTKEETDYLKTAYRYTIQGGLSKAQIKDRYGVYSPIASAAANLVSQRAGLKFSSYNHSGVNVPVFAIGRGAESFAGVYENTAICEALATLAGQ